MGSGIWDLGSSRSNCLENHDSNTGGPDGPPGRLKVIIIISINIINILVITHYHPLHHHHHGQDHPDYSDTQWCGGCVVREKPVPAQLVTLPRACYNIRLDTHAGEYTNTQVYKYKNTQKQSRAKNTKTICAVLFTA